jgi:hypothetical protein
VEQSKYGKYRRRRVPRHRRGQQLEGSFEDKGKWFKCPNCGQIINIEKENGDPERDGLYYVDDITPSPSPVGSGDPLNALSVMDSWALMGLGMELGPDGVTPREIYKNFKHQVSGGCAFCGTMNLP